MSWPDVYSEADRFWEEIRDPAPWIRGLLCLAISLPVGYVVHLITKCMPETPDLPRVYEIMEAWKEYKPIIFDPIFASSPVRAMRAMRIRSRNIAISKNSAPLLQLPNELLLEICDWVVCKCPYCEGSRCSNHWKARAARVNLISLSMTSRRMREVAASLLFDAVSINHGSWWRIERAFIAMERSAHPDRLAKTFTLYLRDLRLTNRTWLPRSTPKRLAMRLTAIEKLEKLELSFVSTSRQRDTFRAVFTNRKVVLPAVRTLVIGHTSEWLVPFCPNVKTVVLDRLFMRDRPHDDFESVVRLIYAARSANHLVHFEIKDRHLTLPLLVAIHKHIPHLTSLGTVHGDYGSGIDDWLSCLASFPTLRTVVMDGLADLNMGYNPPRCGTSLVRMGKEARAAYYKDLEKQKQQALERLGRIMFVRVSALHELWVGDYDRAIVTRDQAGRVSDITWSKEWRHGSVHGHRFG